MSTDELADLLADIMDDIDVGRWDKIDDHLDHMERSLADYELIVPLAWLRATYMFRDRLENWADLRNSLRVHLRNLGQDADKALRGL